MKKWTVVILLMCIGFGLKAQMKPFRFGLKIAPQLSWLAPATDDCVNNGSSAAWSWGFVSDITLTDNLFLGSGFNVVYTKGKLKYLDMRTPDAVDLAYRDYRLSYLEIPLTIKMKTRKMGDLVYFGQLGLGTAINLSARAEDSYKVGLMPDGGERTEHDINKEIRFLKESLIIGAGVEYDLPNTLTLFSSVVYNAGFSNVLKGKNTYNNDDFSAKPNYIELNVGLIF